MRGSKSENRSTSGGPLWKWRKDSANTTRIPKRAKAQHSSQYPAIPGRRISNIKCRQGDPKQHHLQERAPTEAVNTGPSKKGIPVKTGNQKHPLLVTTEHYMLHTTGPGHYRRCQDGPLQNKTAATPGPQQHPTTREGRAEAVKTNLFQKETAAKVDPKKTFIYRSEPYGSRQDGHFQ